MKKIVFSLFVMGLGFSASAQNSEAAVQATSTKEVKKETVNSAAQDEANAEARITELRHAVRNLEMRKKAISEDKSLTPEARKAMLEELYAEHDKLAEKLKKEATKN